MLNSILRIIGRILLILLVAGVVIGAAFGLSTFTGGTGRFRSGEGQRFTQPSAGANNEAGQVGRPPRGGGDDEGVPNNGSISRGLVQVLTKAVVIGVITWIGLLLLRFYKQLLPGKPREQTEPS